MFVKSGRRALEVNNFQDVPEYSCSDLTTLGMDDEKALAVCTFPNDGPYINYTAPLFRRFPFHPRFHDIPRFGKTRDMVNYVNGTPKQQTEYMRGLKGTAIITWVIFALWALLLIFCRWKHAGGILSGSPPPKPASLEREVPDETDTKPSWCRQKLEIVTAILHPWKMKGEPINNDAGTQSSDQPSPDPARKNRFLMAWFRRSRRNANENPASDAEVEVEAQGTNNMHEAAEKETKSVERIKGTWFYDEEDNGNGHEADEQEIIRIETDSFCDEEDVANEEGNGNEVDKALSVDPNTEAKDMAQYELNVNHYQKRVFYSRIFVLISGVLIIVLSGILIRRGFESLNAVIQSLINVLPPLHNILNLSYTASNNYLLQLNQTIEAQQSLVVQIVENCPPGHNFTTTINNVLNATRYFHGAVENANITLFNLTRDVGNLYDTINTVEDWWYQVVTTFIFIIDILVIGFMIGVVLAWREIQPRFFQLFNTKVALPLFCILLFASYMISTYCLIFSTFISDFCYETPDNQILRIIDAPYPLDRYFEWYISGCEVGQRPVFLTVFIRGLIALWVFIARSLDELLSSSPVNDGIREVCNLGNSTLLFDSLKLFSHKLNISVELAIGMLAPFECTNFNPVYGDLVYETACNHGFDATTEIFRYLFTLTVFCMILVTLRVAWYDNIKVETIGNDNHLDNASEPNESSSSPIEHSSDHPLENSFDDAQEQHL